MKQSISYLMVAALLIAMLAGCSTTTDREPDNVQATNNAQPTETAASAELDPDFKKTMEKYEEFFDEYVEFMKKYNENPADATLLLKYADMMTQYTEAMKALEEWDTSNMTQEELAYYTEVMARITQKLASVT